MGQLLTDVYHMMVDHMLECNACETTVAVLLAYRDELESVFHILILVMMFIFLVREISVVLIVQQVLIQVLIAPINEVNNNNNNNKYQNSDYRVGLKQMNYLHR